MATTAFTRATTPSRERVSRVEEDIREQIDVLTRKVTEAIARLEVNIGALETKLMASLSTANKKIQTLEEENRLLKLNMLQLRGEISSVKEIAIKALDHADNHAHRYNPSCDWRTGKAYQVDPSTPQWAIP
jgi:chromosome segregation ATPase